MAKKEYSKLVIKLGKKLKEIYDKDDFIIGVLSYVIDDDGDCQKIIDFIDAGVDVDDETITVLAMDLCDAREN